MRRRLLFPLLFALVVLALVGGIYLGGHPDLLPSGVREALVSDSDAQVYDEALDIIADDYYRPIDRDRLLDVALGAAVKSLRDRFSTYIDPRAYRHFRQATSGEFDGVGLTVSEHRRGLRVGEVFARSPAARAGIRSGDLIVRVDGRSLAGKPSRVSTALIKGPAGTPVRLRLLRAGRERDVTLRRARISVPVVEARLRERAGRKWGHVALAAFTDGAHGEVSRKVRRVLRQGADGIVLDLRGNGGGLLDEAVLVSSVFVPEGVIVSTRGRSRPRRVFRATGDAIARRVPVVVLVDRATASAAEIVTAALRDHERATVVGTRTFGKGVFQEVRRLNNDGALDITVGEYFTPDGDNLGGGGVRVGAGVAPDVAARDLPKTRRDEALERALAVLAARAR